MYQFLALITLFIFFSAQAEWQKVPGAGASEKAYFNILSFSVNPNNTFARTGGNKIHKWTGTKWEKFPSPKGQIIALTTTNDGNLYALARPKFITKNQKRALEQPLYHWEQNKWNQVYNFDKEVTSIAGIKKNDLALVYDGRPFRWNGTSIRPLGFTNNLIQIFASPDEAFWAVSKTAKNNTMRTNILKWDGNKWQTVSTYVKTETPIIPEVVAIVDKDNVVMIHDLDAYKFDNETEAFKLLKSQNKFVDIAASPDGTIWALDEADGSIYQWKEAKESITDKKDINKKEQQPKVSSSA